VASANRNVIYPHLAFVATSQFELRFFIGDGEHVDVPGSVLVQWHGLKKNVLGSFWGLSDVNQFEKGVVAFEYIRVGLLTDFALKFLPVVTCHVFSILFDVPLILHPVFEALEVDQAYRPSALAREN